MMGMSGRARWLLAVTSLLFACSSFAATSRLHPPSKKWAGALRVTEIMAVATRAEILSLGVHYELLIASGIEDSDLQDGSLAVGRTMCCGATDEGLAIWLYIPPGLEVAVDDIVEVRMGRKPSGKDPGEVNIATRVRVRKSEDDGSCWWDPRDERLWRRVLRCTWMEEEGWILSKGMKKTWMKPASAGEDR